LKKIFYALIIISQVSNAQSFDCAKAKTQSEKSICKNKELSSLDSDLNKSFKEKHDFLKTKNVVLAEFFRSNQNDWIWLRDLICKADVSCLKDIYKTRIKDLIKYDNGDTKTIDYFYVSMQSPENAKLSIHVEYPEFFGTDANIIKNARNFSGIRTERNLKEASLEGPLDVQFEVKKINSDLLYVYRIYSCSGPCPPEILVYDLKNGEEIDFWKNLKENAQKKYLRSVRLNGEKKRKDDDCREDYAEDKFDQTSLEVEFKKDKIVLSPFFVAYSQACVEDLEIEAQDFIKDLKGSRYKDLLKDLTN
jgi:uncharacterized protein